MVFGSYRFGDFSLSPGDRQLCRKNESLEINARYFDALVLMVKEQGRLVSKERFFSEVWQGVPVTDEALTQCIRTLRRLLGDSATNPVFIETVPKHGYRFIAQTEWFEPQQAAETVETRSHWRQFLETTWAGIAGGAVAGFIGGLIFGGIGVVQALQAKTASISALSLLLVVLCLTLAIAIVGAAGVSSGIASARLIPVKNRFICIPMAAAGGMLVGAAGQFIGMDAFHLLFGQAPVDITGGSEGFMLGAAVGTGVMLASWAKAADISGTMWRALAAGALSGGVAAIIINVSGGQLMGASLHALAQSFPDSRMRLDAIGVLFGESGFGPVSQLVLTVIEGMLFTAFMVVALTFIGHKRHK